MDEDVRAVPVRGDEPEALLGVEPLDRALCHFPSTSPHGPDRRRPELERSGSRIAAPRQPLSGFGAHRPHRPAGAQVGARSRERPASVLSRCAARHRPARLEELTWRDACAGWSWPAARAHPAAHPAHPAPREHLARTSRGAPGPGRRRAGHRHLRRARRPGRGGRPWPRARAGRRLRPAARPRGTARQVAVDEAGRPRSVRSRGAVGPGWALTPAGAAGRGEVLKRTACSPRPRGQILCGPDTACEIAFWPQITATTSRASTAAVPARHQAGAHPQRRRPLPRPAAVGARSHPAHHWPLEGPLPDIFEVREPVDLVYTWVDGHDPDWQARKTRTRRAPARTTPRAARAGPLHRPRRAAVLAALGRDVRQLGAPDLPRHRRAGARLAGHRASADRGSSTTATSSATRARCRCSTRTRSSRSCTTSTGWPSTTSTSTTTCSSAGRSSPSCSSTATGWPSSSSRKTPLDLEPPSLRDLPVMTAAKNQRALLETRLRGDGPPQVPARCAPAVAQRARGDGAALPGPVRPTSPARGSATRTTSRSRRRCMHYYAYARGRAVPADGLPLPGHRPPNTPRRLDRSCASGRRCSASTTSTAREHQLDAQHSALTAVLRRVLPAAGTVGTDVTDQPVLIAR